MIHGKNSFAEGLKDLAGYRSQNVFVNHKPSK